MAISIQLILLLVVTTVVMLNASDLMIWKIIIAALLFIPSSAQGLISGTSYSTPGVLNLSMVGYISVVGCCIILGRYKRLSQKKAACIFGALTIIVLVRIITDGYDFISNKLFDNYIIPMILAVVMYTTIQKNSLPYLLKYIYILIFIGAVIACIEYIYGSSLLFHEYYMGNYPWYENIYVSSQYVAFRSTSLYGHPLIGGIYYTLGIVYLMNSVTIKRNKIAWAIQFFILFAAILSTNSRSSLLGITVYIVYYLFRNKKIGNIFFFVSLIILGAIFIDWNDLYYTFFARDVTKSSVMVRIRALESIKSIPVKTFLLGEGYNNTSELLSRLGFTGNVEISYLIILLENGIICFIAWLFTIAVFYTRNTVQGLYKGIYISNILKGMLFCIFLIGGMSNSFGDPGTLNYLIYILLSFVSILGK